MARCSSPTTCSRGCSSASFWRRTRRQPSRPGWCRIWRSMRCRTGAAPIRRRARSSSGWPGGTASWGCSPWPGPPSSSTGARGGPRWWPCWVRSYSIWTSRFTISSAGIRSQRPCSAFTSGSRTSRSKGCPMSSPTGWRSRSLT